MLGSSVFAGEVVEISDDDGEGVFNYCPPSRELEEDNDAQLIGNSKKSSQSRWEKHKKAIKIKKDKKNKKDKRDKENQDNKDDTDKTRSKR
jgi:Mg-chelatase subunit ChlI